MLLMLSFGCRPGPPLQYELSQAVADLTSELETEEELQLYRGLQDEIEKTLREKCGTPQRPKLLGADDEATTARLEEGAAIYERRCASCHGTTGDGNGPVAKYLNPKPRDYRQGIYKFTTTPYGGKPRRSDLIATIRRGVTGTAMPSFQALSAAEVEAVVDYVLALTLRGELEYELVQMALAEEAIDAEYVDEAIENLLFAWREAESQLVMPVSMMPEFTPETVALGKKIYLEQACNKCHGVDGRGGLLGNVEVGEDVWGNKAAAADLTSGMFHGGGRPIDIYRRIYSGINGTPMPAFGNYFEEDPDAIWHLVHFIKEIGERRRANLPPGIGQESAGGPGAEDAAPADADADADGNDDADADASDEVEADADGDADADGPTDAAA